MPRISKPHHLTPQQRLEIMRKQIEREPERINRWNTERERQIKEVRERDSCDHSKFPRASDSSQRL